MSRKTLALAVSIITLGFAGSALAQTTSKPDRAKWEQNFKKADKNGDGGLSKEEVAKFKNSGIKNNFDAMDTNHDGKVTMAEHDAWQAQQQAAKKAAKKSSMTK